MNIRKSLATIGAGLAMTTAAVGIASPASAAPNPYDPARICGEGYKVIDSHPLPTANIYLLWSSSAGKNCVVTLLDQVGDPTYVGAYLEVQGKSAQVDVGNYTYYAGNIKAAAVNLCVRWGGADSYAEWTSDWSHC
jgi:hypothetical protein